jgi:hypothetical protein
LPTYQLRTTTKYSYSVTLDYVISPNLKMKSKFQSSRLIFNGRDSDGYLLLQDVTASWRNLKCSARYALFDTDDFDNRQYAYEHDVWLSYTFPAYFGKGTRRYVVIQYKVNKIITLWLKYSNTRYIDRNSIGSGSDQIAGNQRNELKFESRIKF